MGGNTKDQTRTFLSDVLAIPKGKTVCFDTMFDGHSALLHDSDAILLVSLLQPGLRGGDGGAAAPPHGARAAALHRRALHPRAAGRVHSQARLPLEAPGQFKLLLMMGKQIKVFNRGPSVLVTTRARRLRGSELDPHNPISATQSAQPRPVQPDQHDWCN